MACNPGGPRRAGFGLIGATATWSAPPWQAKRTMSTHAEHAAMVVQGAAFFCNRGKTPGIPSLPIISIAFISVLWCR